MKTVLMVCKHFSPQNTVAAIRPTKLAKYLQRSGRYSVYVVYEDSAKAEFSDELLQKDREELSGVCALSPGLLYKLFTSSGRWISSLLHPKSKGKPEYENRTYLLNSALDTTIQGTGRLAEFLRNTMNLHFRFGQWLAAKSALRTAKKFSVDFDVIFTTDSPIFCDYVGLMAKRHWPNALWVADFRDYVFNPREHTAAYKKFLTKFMHKVVKHANLVTGVLADFFLRDEFPESGKYKELTLGFDKEDITNITPATFDNNQLHIAFTGSLYPWFHESFFTLMQRCIVEDGLPRQNIRIHYAGLHGRQFLTAAQSFQLDDIVQDHGFVPRKESLALQLGADFIALCDDWNGFGGGRGAERMMMNVPMLAIITSNVRNSRLEQYAQQHGFGLVVKKTGTVIDTANAQSHIAAALKAKQAGHAPFYQPDQTLLEQYSYPHLANQLASWIEAN